MRFGLETHKKLFVIMPDPGLCHLLDEKAKPFVSSCAIGATVNEDTQHCFRIDELLTQFKEPFTQRPVPFLASSVLLRIQGYAKRIKMVCVKVAKQRQPACCFQVIFAKERKVPPLTPERSFLRDEENAIIRRELKPFSDFKNFGPKIRLFRKISLALDPSKAK